MTDLRMTVPASEAISRAKEIAKEHAHPEIQPVHLLFSLLVPEDGAAARVVAALGREVGMIRGLVQDSLDELPGSPAPVYEPATSAGLKGTLELAETERDVREENLVDEIHLLIALVSPDGGLPGDLRKSLQIRRKTVLDVIEKARQAEAVVGRTEGGAAGGGAPSDGVGFCSDLTAKARAGRLDPVIGREREIQQVIEVLARRRKNNVVLTGEPGVGKTAVVEGLALELVRGTVPAFLRSAKILELDLPAMVAGAKYKGEFEERFKKMLAQLEAAGDEAILFVDEIHSLLGAGGGGGGIDAANILKPALARGEIRVIGATTIGEYRKHFDADAAFARRFVPIQIEEPDRTTMLRILEGLRECYEAHHGVRFIEEAFEAAITMSKRYIPDRFLPDKAVDLLDEAAADVRILVDTIAEARPLLEKPDDDATKSHLERLRASLKDRNLLDEGEAEKDPLAWLVSAEKIEKTVAASQVARRVSIRTGIPVHRMMGDEREKLLRIDETLNSRVVGQEEAVRAVSDAVRRGRAGLKRANLPVGAFMLLGPTGTGKTYLAKSLAVFLFNDEKAMVRIDMSEFKGEHTVQRLIGPPPGYVGYEAGGALTNAVLRRPYSVVLFDEIEKAHPQVLDPLLQVLDDGRLTDGQSRLVDFSNAVVILTTNLAGRWISEQDSKGLPVDQKVLREMLMQQGLRPELLNRFERLLVFHQFNKEQVGKIVELQLRDVEGILAEQKLKLEVTPAAKEILATEGFDPEMGARPVRRVIDSKIMNPLASLVVEVGEVAGKTVFVDAGNGELTIRLS